MEHLTAHINETKGDVRAVYLNCGEGYKNCMEEKTYTLTRIEGEYAYLFDEISGEEIFVALALLPPGADVGSRLSYEMFTYTLL